MDEFKRRCAASEIEIAAEMFRLGIEGLRQVADEYPQLDYFVTELIRSYSNGDFQLPCVPDVPDFLRFGDDTDDKYVEDYLLGWVLKPAEKDEA